MARRERNRAPAVIACLLWAGALTVAGCSSATTTANPGAAEVPTTPATTGAVLVATDAPVATASPTAQTSPSPPCDPKNLTECKERCQKGDEQSCFSAAKLLQAGSRVGGPEEKEIIPVYQKVCDGHGPNTAEACGRLAYLLFLSPTAQNVIHALEYGKKGCDLGSAVGCVFLAKEDTQSGWAARAKNYERACELGEKTACVQAGLVAVEGREGVPKEPAKGLKLLDDACTAGEPTACADLYFLYDRGSVKGGVPTGVKPDPAKWDAYKKKYCALNAKGHGISCP